MPTSANIKTRFMMAIRLHATWHPSSHHPSIHPSIGRILVIKYKPRFFSVRHGGSYLNRCIIWLWCCGKCIVLIIRVDSWDGWELKYYDRTFIQPTDFGLRTSSVKRFNDQMPYTIKSLSWLALLHLHFIRLPVKYVDWSTVAWIRTRTTGRQAQRVSN